MTGGRDQAPNNASQGPVHPSNDNDAVGASQIRQSDTQQVQDRDPDVLVDDHLGPQQLRSHPSLVQHRPVRRGRGDDRHTTANSRETTRNPHRPRQHMFLGVGSDLRHRRSRRFVGPRHQHAASTSLQQSCHDPCHLLGGFPLAKHRLRRPLTQLPVSVHPREA